MKSITYISRSISDLDLQAQNFDPDVAFADPVGYLAALGIESQLVSLGETRTVREAA